jgi:hypothetical protein
VRVLEAHGWFWTTLDSAVRTLRHKAEKAATKSGNLMADRLYRSTLEELCLSLN